MSGNRRPTSKRVTSVLSLLSFCAAMLALAPVAPAVAAGGVPPVVFVTNLLGDAVVNTVTPISTSSNIASAPISVGGGPVAIAITPDNRSAYTYNWASGTVTPIALGTNTPGTPIRVGPELCICSGPIPFPGIAITPDNKTAYVANSVSDT